MNPSVVDLLTEREMQCVQLWLKGLTRKEVARRLFISENTVRTHISKVYFKLNVNTKLELHTALTGAKFDDEQPPCVQRGIEDVARFLATLNVARRVETWDDAVAVVRSEWAKEKFDDVRRSFTGDAWRLMLWLGVDTPDGRPSTSLSVHV